VTNLPGICHFMVGGPKLHYTPQYDEISL